MDSAKVKEFLLELQGLIVERLEQVDGKPFRRDEWQRPQGGGGLTRLIEEGNVLERGGVNFSHVMGDQLPPSATAHRPELAGRHWQAMGVSLVMHPRNPYAPTTHMNVRFFVAEKAGEAPVWWFGGGMDLTPYYGYEEDAEHFHDVCRRSLLPFGADYYPRFKKWCDDYFFLKHRNEPRGIGGIFFDDFSERDFDHSFNLTESVGDHFLSAYLPILERRMDTPYGERERDFQATGAAATSSSTWSGTGAPCSDCNRAAARVDPDVAAPVVKWRYDWQPEPGTEEARLYSDFLRPRDWLRD